MTPPGWSKLEHDAVDRLTKLGPIEMAVYVALLRHVNAARSCCPSMHRIADVAGVSTRRAKVAIKKLVDVELVEREDRTTLNGATMTPQYRLPLLSPTDPGEQNDPGGTKRPGEGGERNDPGGLFVSKGGERNDPQTRIKNKTQARASRNGYTPAFENFWQAVAPHKRKSKAEAFKRFREAVKALDGQHDDPVAFLLDRVTAYYQSPLGQTCYAHGPAPWLHQGGFDDDPAAWQRSENGNGKPAEDAEPIVYRDQAKVKR